MTDFADWTHGITIVESGAPMTDFADWTIPVEVVPGGGGTGYASLTGNGETHTPGNLTQEGGLSVFDTIGGGFVVGATGVIDIETTNGNPVKLVNNGTGGTTIHSSGSGPVTILADGNSGGVQVKANNGSGTNFVDIQAVGNGGGVAIAAGLTVDLLNRLGNHVEIFGRDFIDLAYGEDSTAALGGRGITIGDAGPQTAGILLTVHHGSPSGAFLGSSNGDLCVDTLTPGLWQWHSATSTWVAF